MSCKTTEQSPVQTSEDLQESLKLEQASSFRAWSDIELWVRKQPPSSLTQAEERNLRLTHELLEQGKLEEAELLLDGLRDDARPGLSVRAWNAQGILETLRQDPYAAEVAWQKAMEIDPSAPYLRRNLGTLYLQFGFFDKVLALIEPSSKDFQLAYLRLVAERNLGMNREVDRRCAQMLDDRPTHRGLLFNCSLHEFQNNRHADRAIELMEACLKASGDDQRLTGEAQELLKQMTDWKEKYQAR